MQLERSHEPEAKENSIQQIPRKNKQLKYLAILYNGRPSIVFAERPKLIIMQHDPKFDLRFI